MKEISYEKAADSTSKMFTVDTTQRSSKATAMLLLGMTYDKRTDSEVNESQRLRLYPPGMRAKPVRKSSKKDQKSMAKQTFAADNDDLKTMPQKIKASIKKRALLGKSKKSKKGEKSKSKADEDEEEESRFSTSKRKIQKKH